MTHLDPLEIDPFNRFIRRGQHYIRLGRKERALLDFLVANANQTLTHRQLLREIWGDAYDEGSRYLLHTSVARLRKKLEIECILNESDIGYRFVVLDPALVQIHDRRRDGRQSGT